ncbi:MAG: DNA-3-methyladenine glycosylase family protein, partial [Verrucomicrobiia bacterium]
MSRTAVFPLRDYDLAATLTSGQAFRWREANGPVIEWENIIAGRWVRLHVKDKQLHAQTAKPQKDWHWLTDYLQLEVNLKKILATFPKDDPHLAAARKTCRGLRLLKQDPWETLAGFICSSNKRIVQIQQIIADLCNRFGEPIPTNGGEWQTFPTAARLASLTEADLRDCRMGYRAKYLHATATMIAQNQIDLPAIAALNYEPAKAELQRLPGIGPKVADCILLFAYAHPQAFPLDTWIIKALRQLYFPRRNPTPKQLQTFI